MVVGRLRMKGTTESSEKKSKRRRRNLPSSVHSPPHANGSDLSNSPPADSSPASVPLPFDRKGKSGAGEDEDFHMRMKSALNTDNGSDVRLEWLFQNDFYMPRRWHRQDGFVNSQSDLNGNVLSEMDSEEYQEYLRKQMWSQSHRKDYLDNKAREQRESEEHERLSRERCRQRILSKQKAKQKAERESQRFEKERQKCRDHYYRRWEVLNSALNDQHLNHQHQSSALAGTKSSFNSQVQRNLRFEEIPWPVYTLQSGDGRDQPTPSIEHINLDAVREFLLGHVRGDNLDDKKKILRTALLTYHPDRFDRIINKIKATADSQSSASHARDYGLKVSQILNELIHD